MYACIEFKLVREQNLAKSALSISVGKDLKLNLSADKIFKLAFLRKISSS